jgi:tetratricopeptide (TPR) repeat protein
MRATKLLNAAALFAIPAVFAVASFNCCVFTANDSYASATEEAAVVAKAAVPDVQTGSVDSGPTAAMRTAYRDGDFETVRRQFEALNVPGVSDHVKYQACYLMGRMCMRIDDYDNARRFFDMITDNKHPDYAFARHAVAEMLYTDRENKEDAIDALELVIGVKPKNRAQAEIINRSYVFLGFIFYEDHQLASAVTALRTVPRNSRHYIDAQLGLGWTAQQARQWGDSFNAGTEAVNTTTDLYLQSEGNLLQAYALAMQKDYSRAVDILTEANTKLLSYPGHDEAEIAARRNEYNEYEGKLFFSREYEITLDDVQFALARFTRIASRAK